MTEPDAAARRMRVVFMGTGEIGVPAFRWLLAAPECEVVAAVSQPDKPAGRKLELRSSAIKQLAVERGVPVLQPVRMRAPDAVAEIVALPAIWMLPPSRPMASTEEAADALPLTELALTKLVS